MLVNKKQLYNLQIFKYSYQKSFLEHIGHNGINLINISYLNLYII